MRYSAILQKITFFFRKFSSVKYKYLVIQVSQIDFKNNGNNGQK